MIIKISRKLGFLSPMCLGAMLVFSSSAWSFPSAIDSDADKIPDALELYMGGDQVGTDTDADGIPDVVESELQHQQQ